MVTNLLKLISQFFEERQRDIAPDLRSSFEKDKDYKYGEDILLPKGEVNKRITKLPIEAYHQGSTSGCGAFSAAHARALYEGTYTYPVQWYRTRSNYAGEGMFLQDVLKLATRADLVPVPKISPKLTEEFANSLALVDVYNNTRKENYEYTQIKPYDADAVFDAVSNGYPVIVSFFATRNEWIEEMIPTDVVSVYTAPVRHYIVALPKSNHIKDGEEWVSVIDSSPAKGFSLRHVRKDFLEKRMYIGGGFYYSVKTEKSKVKVVPTNHCSYGERSESVKGLQLFLVTEGYMSNVHTTGYYGNITAKAVLEWQLHNIRFMKSTSIEWVNTLVALDGHYWGPQSVAAVKNKYNVS